MQNLKKFDVVLRNQTLLGEDVNVHVEFYYEDGCLLEFAEWCGVGETQEYMSQEIIAEIMGKLGLRWHAEVMVDANYEPDEFVDERGFFTCKGEEGDWVLKIRCEDWWVGDRNLTDAVGEGLENALFPEIVGVWCKVNRVLNSAKQTEPHAE